MRKLWVNRQAEYLRGGALADAQSRRAGDETTLIGRLAMDRSGIVDCGSDPGGMQPLAQRIALSEPDHILVKDVGRVRLTNRDSEGQTCQTGIVTARYRLSLQIIRFEAFQLDAEDCCLDRVEAGIDSRPGTDIALTPTVLSNFTRSLGENRIVGHEDAAIPERPQILCRIKAEAANIAKASRWFSAPQRTVALCTIFY